jgi:FemAB-related protein (PEP-CTERM system-associated)
MTGLPGTIRVRREFQDAEWTSFVEAHPDAALYHTLPWRNFIADVFGHAPRYMVAHEGDRLAGILPLFHVRVPVLGSKLISLPYDIGSGGALVTAAAAEEALAREAITLARELNVDYLELRHGSDRPALAPLSLRTQTPVLISDMVLDGETAVQARIASDHRKAVRKATSRGVTVRQAVTLEDYRAFYDVYLRVFRDFGTPPYHARYFTELWKRFQSGGAARLFLADTGGRCVGGLMMFCWQRSLVSKFAACLPEAVPLRAYAALYWRAIEFGLANGYRRLSWGTSSRDQTGLIEFKERWGATTQPAVLYDLDVRGRAPDLASYYDSGGLARKVWRRLPLGITRAGGAVLNRWFC